MRSLNQGASEVFVANGIRAATDITGFGLLGHGLEMARASGARIVFDASLLPALPGALDLARAGVETGGAAHNRRFVSADLRIREGTADELVTLAHDPQTSGGLLAAVPGTVLDRVLTDLDVAGVHAWRVGRVEGGSGVALV
jgi:selenide,water dikinase